MTTGADNQSGDYNIVDDGTVYKIATGVGNDDITVVQLPDGSATVTINGHELTLTPDQARRLEIDAGAGNDIITVHGASDPTSTAGVVIHGGGGNDQIIGGPGDDTLSGGPGRDYIDGGSGDDTLLGGRGKDTIYGGLGHDEVSGGASRDYIDGGPGHDLLKGGTGDDFLSGGHGVDDIDGGPGNDIAAGGAEVDRFASIERVHDEFVPTSGSSITIEGAPEFVARVEADLATLRSLPEGRARQPR